MEPITVAPDCPTLAAPIAPRETPVEESEIVKDPWDIPHTGIDYCQCGDGCTLDSIDTEAEFELIGFSDDDMVPHKAVLAVIQFIYSYITVCEFFTDHVNLSARKVNGEVAREYTFDTAVGIVGYFYNTWQGCPQESCAGNDDYASEYYPQSDCGCTDWDEALDELDSH